MYFGVVCVAGRLCLDNRFINLVTLWKVLSFSRRQWPGHYFFYLEWVLKLKPIWEALGVLIRRKRNNRIQDRFSTLLSTLPNQSRMSQLDHQDATRWDSQTSVTSAAVSTALALSFFHSDTSLSLIPTWFRWVLSDQGTSIEVGRWRWVETAREFKNDAKFKKSQQKECCTQL